MISSLEELLQFIIVNLQKEDVHVSIDITSGVSLYHSNLWGRNSWNSGIIHFVFDEDYHCAICLRTRDYESTYMSATYFETDLESSGYDDISFGDDDCNISRITSDAHIKFSCTIRSSEMRDTLQTIFHRIEDIWSTPLDDIFWESIKELQ